MILLQWAWTTRPGPYVRATFASQPAVVVAPVVAGLAVGLLLVGDIGLFGAVLAGLLAVALTVLALVGVVSHQLRRVQRASGAAVQWYAITEDAIVITAGEDRYSLPRRDLRIARTGSGWVALRRGGAGGRRIVLLFDDPMVVPHVASLLGAAERGSRS